MQRTGRRHEGIRIYQIEHGYVTTTLRSSTRGFGGIAPDANIINLKVLDANGNVTAALGGSVTIAGVLGQTFSKCRERPQWRHIVFNVAAVPLAVVAAGYCKDLSWIAACDRFGLCSIIAASLVYFAVNSLVMSGIIGLTTGQPVMEVWRDSNLWAFPQYLVGSLIAAGFHLMLHSIGWAGLLVAIPVVYLVYRSYSIYLSRVEEQQKHIAEMARLHLRTIEALALAIDAKDDTTAAHPGARFPGRRADALPTPGRRLHARSPQNSAQYQRQSRHRSGECAEV